MRGDSPAHHMGRDQGDIPLMTALILQCCETEDLGLGEPCFGICCGAQLLAIALGAEARPSPVVEIGLTELALTRAGRADPVLRGFPDRFPAFEWHADTFDVPPGADLLVVGEASRNQMFRKGRAVGVMFHLEVSAEVAGGWARAYADELREAGKTAEEVVAECRAREGEMRELGRRLVGNCLSQGGSQ